MTYARGIHVIISLISLLATIGMVLPSSAHADMLHSFLNFTSVNRADAAIVSDTESYNTNLSVLKPALNIDPSPKTANSNTVITDTALVPTANPSSSSETVAATATAISVYTVRSGDTLLTVAKLFGVSMNTVRWANNIPKNGTIKQDQVLVILPISGVQYVTKKGDTLASIAKHFGSDVSDIANFNGVDEAPLVIGTTLIIPNGESEDAAPIKNNVKTTIKSIFIINKSGRHIATGGREPAHDVGPEGSVAQVAYYTSPVIDYTKTQDIHGYNAVDMGAPTGTSVYAAAGGIVIIAREGGYNGGYGSYVVISHSNGSQTLYSHLSSVDIAQGETVSRGERIGAIGHTGWATGPHLHFEIRNGIMNPF